jgi:hypothetical protein
MLSSVFLLFLNIFREVDIVAFAVDLKAGNHSVHSAVEQTAVVAVNVAGRVYGRAGLKIPLSFGTVDTPTDLGA